VISSIEIAWVAGILEGEGSFSRSHRTVRISLEMCDRDIVERVAAHWQTRVLKKLKSKRLILVQNII